MRVLSYHEFDGAWAIFPDVTGMEQEELELGPREILPVLQRAEEKLRAAGAVVMEGLTEEA